jgi:hypothetical protein
MNLYAYTKDEMLCCQELPEKEEADEISISPLHI